MKKLIKMLCLLSVLSGCTLGGAGMPAAVDGAISQNILLDNGASLDITELKVKSQSPTAVEVSFITSFETRCEVLYGFSSETLDQSATDPSMNPDDPYAFEHTVLIENLSPETKYFYQIKAEDRDGNVFLSHTYDFQTEAAAEDPNAGFMNVATQAAGMQVLQVSSNFGGGANDSDFGIDHAFDAEMATEWSSQGDGNSAEFQLDLGTFQSIQRITLRSREMADGSSIIQSFRLLLDSGVVLGPYETPDPKELYSFDLNVPVTTKTVRFQVLQSTGGNTGLRHFGLWVKAQTELSN